jgi:DMSO/TMAO reductase YedYZ molybdopterin-dependent catalytic subunit
MTTRSGSSLPRHSGWWGAASGALAAAVAIGIAQLLAGLTVPAASPVVAVGGAAIDRTPLAVKEWATSTFGTGDKTVLLGGVFVVLFLYAMGIGAVAMRRLWLGFCGLVLFAGLGLAAALTRHDASGSYAVPTLFGAAAGALALWRLIVAARAAGARAASARAQPWQGDQAPAEDVPPAAPSGGGAGSGWVPEPMRAGPPAGRFLEAGAPQQAAGARRTFLLTAGGAIAVAAIGEIGGRSLATRKNVSLAQTRIRFPKAAVPAAPPPAGASLPIKGISPFITPNGSFYRVDTALLVPQVDPGNWQLRIHGMVRRELVINFAELLRRPLTEDYLTLCCVSNPVGGPYIGNAKWLGASLASLLREARPLGGADQLLATSADGFTSGTPLQVVLDGRDALVAVAMNGAALPTEHGFPARLVVPGLYGYVSACKWVVDLEVTTFAAAQGYWVPRGWSALGPVKTESRIDVPAPGSSVTGKVPVAGVAWAQHKGIEAVEVRVNGGPWQEATLAAVPGIDTWRQWVWEWDASTVRPGTYLIEARATDKTGYTQTSAIADVAPNGATGYPSTQVNVS